MNKVAWDRWGGGVLGGLVKEVSLEGRTHQAVQKMVERLLMLQNAWERADTSLC